MSQETERIPVPTNGKGPHPIPTADTSPEAAPQDVQSITFTPTQLAVGFGILASLILLIVGRLRRGRGRGRRRGWPLG